MKIDRILNIVTRGVWAIQPHRHEAIRETLQAYLAGAQFPTLNDEEEEPQKVAIVGKVAVLNIEGTILPKASGLEAACGAFSLEKFRSDLKAVAANPAVETIVLNIASGGGVITGVPETADLIASVAQSKNVIAWTGDVAASAAYWLGCQASRFYMSKSAEVGSIGVYLGLLDVTRAMEMSGEKLELFKAGEFKATGLPGKPLTDGERQLLQAGVDKAYQQFTAYVSAQRPNVAAEAMQGQCFDCEDAIKAGLVDGEINSLDDLIAYLNQ